MLRGDYELGWGDELDGSEIVGGNFFLGKMIDPFQNFNATIGYDLGFSEVEIAAGKQITSEESGGSLQEQKGLFGRMVEFITQRFLSQMRETDSITYEAESPENFGFEISLFCRSRRKVRRPKLCREFKILNSLESNSKTKRMSVVLRNENGQLLLICKGADRFLSASKLVQAGLKIWFLVGDKMETAINIGLGIQQQQVVEENMCNLTSASGEASVSSNQQQSSSAIPNPNPVKKKRSLPGHPDPDAEVIALSPKTLMATNRFVCEICSKGFQRDQNLQLHRRGHNLPWKLKQRSSKEVRKKVYICPEVACVHHDPSRALGDLTGIKKHFCRKHGEKKWKCDKCSKKYAVQSDWKAHTKICGTREYRCDCGTLFSRRDSFITHRAFCGALAEESARAFAANTVANDHPPLCSQPTASHDPSSLPNISVQQAQFPHLMRTTEASSSTASSQGLQELSLKGEHQQQDFNMRSEIPPWVASQGLGPPLDLPASIYSTRLGPEFQTENQPPRPPLYQISAATPHLSATALLQKAAQMGATMSRPPNSGQMAAADTINATGFGLGLSSHQGMCGGGDGGGGHVLKDMMMASMSSAPCLDGGSFGGALGGILGLKIEGNGVEDLTRSHGRNEGGGGGGRDGNDGMTGDFLSLRTFSHREILNMAGLDPCMASSSSYEQLQENKETWRG